MQIVCFDILPTDSTYEFAFSLEEEKPISINFNALGYETIYFSKNLGSLYIFMHYFPIMAFLCYFFKRLEHPRFKWIKTKLEAVEKKIYWGETLFFFGENYIVFCVSATI